MQQSDLRYEIKMVCEERALPRLMAALKLHPACISTLYPARQVQSVYFDTPEGHALDENLAGISHRKKIRFRWYGSDTHGVQGVLECKLRMNRLGSKNILKIPVPIDVEGVSRSAFRNSLLAHCDDKWRHALSHGLEVAQWISYQREYLITADRTVRITVDQNLRSFDQRHRLHLGRSFATPNPAILVVECKAPASQRERLEEVIQHIPLLPDKCSKFVMASNPAHGPMISRLGW